MIRRPPRSPLFPYTPPFRSVIGTKHLFLLNESIQNFFSIMVSILLLNIRGDDCENFIPHLNEDNKYFFCCFLIPVIFSVGAILRVFTGSSFSIIRSILSCSSCSTNPSVFGLVSNLPHIYITF